MASTVTVAAVQTDPRLGDVTGNTDRVCEAVAAADADLVVLPECAVSGYGFGTREAGWAAAQEVPGPATERLAAVCARSGRWAVCGLLERDGDRLFNAAVLVGPEGLAGRYRKMHRLHLGVDRFTTPGDLGFPVFRTPFGRLGVLICFDLSFPEAARCLKLAGAQLVGVPTNWPEAAAVSCVHAPPVRAQENHVFVATADRVGAESGFRFRGESRICDPDGRILALAGTAEETITATIEPREADRSHRVIVPGAYELDRIAARRPEHYGLVVEGGSSAGA